MSGDLTKKLPASDDEKLTQILASVQSLDLRIGNLEQKVDQRLYDTRPIWEKVASDIAQLNEGQQQFQINLQQLHAGQQRLEEGVEFLRGESREVRTLLRDIFRRLSIFNDTLVTMQADYRDIYDRVRGLELGRN
jgi:chromosome segregation ATPase